MSVDNMTELRKRIPGGKYALARAIAERAKQLQNGALPLVEVRVPNPITVAIDEVLQGKVNFEFKTAEQVEAEAEAAIKAEEKAAAAAARAEARAEAKAAAEAEAVAADEIKDETAESDADETATEAA
jgi:DNA-directed RNA polymerase subunit omega